MANVRLSRLGPNATYIPRPGFGFRVGGNANFSVFRYQHVGIPKAKLKPIFHCDAKTFALVPCVGLDHQREEPTQMFLRRSGI